MAVGKGPGGEEGKKKKKKKKKERKKNMMVSNLVLLRSRLDYNCKLINAVILFPVLFPRFSPQASIFVLAQEPAFRDCGLHMCAAYMGPAGLGDEKNTTELFSLVFPVSRRLSFCCQSLFIHGVAAERHPGILAQDSASSHSQPGKKEAQFINGTGRDMARDGHYAIDRHVFLYQCDQ